MLTVCRHIGPSHEEVQEIVVETLALDIAKVRPIHRYWITLENMGEKETDGPHEVDTDHKPHSTVEPGTLKDTAEPSAYRSSGGLN